VCCDIYRAGEGVHRGWLAQRSRILTSPQRLAVKLSPYHRFMLRQEQKVFENKKLKTIIANSSVIAHEIERFFPNHVAKIEVIRNAVDTNRFNPNLKERFRKETRATLGIPDEAYVCLFVGSGYERKGVPLLLEIFERLTTSIHLIIAGKDKTLQTLRKTNKTERIHLLGAQEDVRPLYGTADLFVFPSLYDPMPNSALEAAASGLPVLASSTTGAADLAESMGIATLDPLEHHAWINAINAFAKGEVTTPPLQDLTVLSQERLAEKLFHLYRSLLDSPT
jgi:UDP-glucose:(heptosyl)LPS alpha-1,3-glucosyltransferase